VLVAIEPYSETPIYQQIRNQIVDALVRADLAKGDTLPSVRRLACDLGINLHTVNKAYQVLADEGYLTITRRGAVVNAAPAHSDDDIKSLEAALSRMVIEARSRRIDDAVIIKSLNKALGASDKAPNASDQAPNASDQAPNASDQAHGASDKAPGASDQAPNASDQAPNASDQAHGASNKGLGRQMANKQTMKE
jgi:DNA-binding transcriptional regulator YhcF (GntR family)